MTIDGDASIGQSLDGRWRRSPPAASRTGHHPTTFCHGWIYQCDPSQRLMEMQTRSACELLRTVSTTVRRSNAMSLQHCANFQNGKVASPSTEQHQTRKSATARLHLWIVMLILTLLSAPNAGAEWQMLPPHDGRQTTPPSQRTGEPVKVGDAWPQDQYFRWLIGTLEVPTTIEGQPTEGRAVGLRLNVGDGGEVWLDGKIHTRFDNDHPALVLVSKNAEPGQKVTIAVQVYGQVQGGDSFGEANWVIVEDSRSRNPVRLRVHPDIVEGKVPESIAGLSQGGGMADYDDATAARLREGNFKWFRMDNVFTQVVKKNGEEYEYDWTDFDRRVDFIVRKLEADPILAVSYMPIPFDAVEDHNRQSAPKSYELWEDLCYRAAKRCIDRGQRVPYWEVWNEVNTGWLKPGPEDKGSERFRKMYQAARGREDVDEEAVRRFEAYCKLYKATVEGIRRADPTAKFGGPALASGPFESEDCGHCAHGKGFAKGLMMYCTEEGLPMDFVSWHEYFQEPEVYVRQANAFREYLREFPRLQESVKSLMVTEWNEAWWTNRPMDHEVGAAYCAACITRAFVPAKIDRPCFFYVKQNDNNFRGDFSLLMQDNVPKATFNVLKMFNHLSGDWVRVSGQDDDVSAVAAWDPMQKKLAVVLVNFRYRHAITRDVEIGVDGVPDSLQGGTWRETVVDIEHANVWHDRSRMELAPISHSDATGATIRVNRTLPANSVVLLEWIGPQGQ